VLWSHRRQGGAWIEAASRSWLQLHVRRLPHEIECLGIEASPFDSWMGVLSGPRQYPSGEIETLTTFPRWSRSFLCEGTRAAPQRYMDQAGWVLFGSRSPSDGETRDPGARRWGPLPTPRHRTRQRSRTRCFWQNRWSPPAAPCPSPCRSSGTCASLLRGVQPTARLAV
jgi:hypothetical protein